MFIQAFELVNNGKSLWEVVKCAANQNTLTKRSNVRTKLQDHMRAKAAVQLVADGTVAIPNLNYTDPTYETSLCK